ncbi:MAG TPA: IS200/IS605 family transposase [Thermodesulfobacteriota bacterium]|nr:IS200/IS605 family transposase [Thermodesulfobacteriota bacterium]
MDGDEIIWARRLSHRISRNLDTSYRHRILNPGVKAYISKLFPKVLRGMTGCEILEQNIQVAHIHLLMVIPPKYAVSEVIGQMKQYTASRLRKKFAWLEKVYWKEQVVWSPGYFVSTVGLDEKQITEYVKGQSHQDSGQAKLEL